MKKKFIHLIKRNLQIQKEHNILASLPITATQAAILGDSRKAQEKDLL